MIILHKLNGDEFVLNSDHIETIEERPDTVITLENEKKYLVQESIDTIIESILDYQRKASIKIKKIDKD
ncbi:flagellar FlbD family protein [Spirochaetota bacterium]